MSKGTAQESIGARIARLRRDKGLTQAELAQALGVSQPVVSDYENDVIGLAVLSHFLDINGCFSPMEILPSEPS